MPTRADFSAELTFVCDSLGAGGIERVVSTLANEWRRRGRRVCVVTMHDRQRFYALDPGVRHLVVDRDGPAWLVGVPKRLRPRRWGSGRLRALLAPLLGEELLRRFSDGAYRHNFNAYLACESWLLRRVHSPVVVSMGTSLNVVTLKGVRGAGPARRHLGAHRHAEPVTA